MAAAASTDVADQNPIGKDFLLGNQVDVTKVVRTMGVDEL